jgi:uncharacterized membrane protein YgdD (TMEM256/DUF423 family)
MRRDHFSIGAFMFAFGVAMGAFGAHGLEGRISNHYLDVWKKACDYWMYASLGVMSVSAFVQNKETNIVANEKVLNRVLGKWGLMTWSIIGAIIFSFSLWILALNEILGTSFRKLGFITPIGGSLLIVVWLLTGSTILGKQHK